MISFEDGDDRFCYVVMQRDISEDPKFESHLEPGRYYDLETPYGYGGPLCDHPVSGQAQKKFITEFTEFAKNRRIVSQFIRFHPLLYNHEVLPAVIETRYLHQTVFIDTSSPELIMANMDSKNRNMVRKAQKNGVTILRRPIDDYHDFLPIYEETMRKDDADDYYFFDGKYFEQQINLKDNACIFYAMREGCPIAAAMMYYNDRYMHYHLAGTRTDSRKYSPGNLLLYEAACWASSRGIRQFHLGGGMEEDDNLFGFKKQFNKNGRLPFYIGRTIFDKCSFDLLKDLRKQINENFDTDNSRMIQYRA
ncbi:MAG: peptidoglycan bridge formation glycyltransferase FemA/FemB family protein [Lachnospiraceae bacterium]|nr:peptidoglycan bridge formation glycyltransferase FemA/FemB family protein [Lachnospiraceae bacterium]